MGRKRDDLSQIKFTRLKPINIDKDNTEKYKKIYWWCKCDCGTMVSVSADNLRSGNIKSCGCYQKELSSKIHSKSNNIEYDNELNCLRVYFNNSNDYFLCDIEDKDIAERYCWYKNNNTYAIARIKGTNSFILFHRLVMEKHYGDISGYEVDHINHNTFDNRRFNIRMCTHGENMRNTKDRSTNFSNSGIRNIFYEKTSNTYKVIINNKYIGSSQYLDMAIKIKNKYIEDNPDKFRYNVENNHIIIKQQKIINPFKSIL